MADEEYMRRSFMAELARLESWLKDKEIRQAIIGSLAVSAYIDQGRSLDFDRPHAYDDTQRVPDVDLLVPRASLPSVHEYSQAARYGDFPINVDTFGAEAYIDFRPESERSYLTHRKLQFPVPTELFAGRQAALLGREITTVDPRTLLHTFGTIGGVIRKKDVPKIVGLAEAIKSGGAGSVFTERDVEVFSQFMIARKRQYPMFIAGKTAWEGMLQVLPPKAGRALKHHLLPGAQKVWGHLNRGPGQTGRGLER